MWPKSLEELRKNCRKNVATWKNYETWSCPSCYANNRELFEFCRKNVIRDRNSQTIIEKLFNAIRKEKLRKLLNDS